jgi:glucosamine-6-phosphate deaminase
MELIIVEDHQQLCQRASQYVIRQIQRKADSVLGLATGSTPEGVYRLLAIDHEQNQTSYRYVRTVNLDEYVGLAHNHPNSYRYYMNHRLFQYLDIPLSQTYLPDGLSPDLEVECRHYDYLIKQLGGVDLQLLGIGLNGHIGFNEPGTPFTSKTHVVELTDSTRKANQRFFASLEDVPNRAITMGIATIMESREILLLVSGQHKAHILHRLFTEEVDEQLPASVLKQHPQVTVLADRMAAKYLPISASLV